MEMEYNTTRSNLILREYGRNFHKLVDYVGNVKSKEERNKMSKTLVDMMKLTHPSFKDQRCSLIFVLPTYAGCV